MSEIIGHGIDIVECDRIRKLVERYGERFLERIFTENERRYCLGRKRQWEHLAGRFAAKEAILKVVGTGWRGQIAWTDMDIVRDQAGKPEVLLTGETKAICEKVGIKQILLSISHTEHYATASAIGIG
jgi:holo-[acyl-carrier protein] synthase